MFLNSVSQEKTYNYNNIDVGDVGISCVENLLLFVSI